MLYYGLNPSHNYTAPVLAWQAALNMLHVELNLFTDMDMHLLIEEGIRGGVSIINHHTDKETSKKWWITMKISPSSTWCS